MQGGVSRRPAPGRVTMILPRAETRTPHSARGSILVSLTPSLPGTMPGSLARDARPTCGLNVPSDAGWRPAPPCYRASYDDPPQSGDTNSPQRERIDSRVVDAIAPRHDAGEPRAGRATHLWVGRPVRCPVGWTSRPMQGGVPRRPATGRVTMILPRAETRLPPQRERNDSRVVDAIAPRHDAGEPRARRATHLWVGRLVRCRAASRAALLPGELR